MSNLLCPLCGQRNDSTGHVCWVEKPTTTAHPDTVIMVDHSEIIRAWEKRVEELENALKECKAKAYSLRTVEAIVDRALLGGGENG